VSRIVYDCETDGLLPELTVVDCLVLHDLDTGVRERFADQPGHTPIELGIKKLERAQMRIAHNAIGFDERAIRKVYPWYNPQGFLVDTLVLTRVLWPDVKRQLDFGLNKKGKLPGNMMGRHTLESWGYRIGNFKGEYTDWCAANGIENPWKDWRPEKLAYCEQDVDVLVTLVERCIRKITREKWRGEWLPLEHEVQRILIRQEERGFAFDEEGAHKLHADLTKRKLILEEELQKAFPPITREIPFYPKKNNKPRGYVAGQLFIKKKIEVFNPSSRKQIAERLKAKYAWEPEEFTKSGEPALDEETMAGLPFPEAATLCEYLMIDKRLGQLAQGQEAWLKHVRNGRIHGRVNSMGTATSRMSHMKPNIAQVPRCDKPYGPECRSLFKAGPGYVLVGIDADALELRDLAAYLAKHDGGAYIEIVLRGEKAKGTDMHSVNCRAMGLDPKKLYRVGAVELSGRDIAKVFFYALIYGAGDAKLGAIMGRNAAAGRRARQNLLKGITGMDKLVKALQVKVKSQGYIHGLDGRVIPIRSEHAALNTLLQSAGAILMKRAVVILDASLQAAGLVPGIDYEFVANVHDEWQIEVKPEHVETVKSHGCTAIKAAGEYYSFRCPLAGNADSGANWAATH
jgi:DNA polymerase I